MMGRICAGVLAIAVLCTACGRHTYKPSDAIFNGLPPRVVTEVLADPDAVSRMSELKENDRDGLAQGIVINFVVCRDAFRVYEEWKSTGQDPALAPLPVPAHPVEPSYADWKRDYARLRHTAQTSLWQLHQWLTGQLSCGEWVPTASGSAQTIEDAIYRSDLGLSTNGRKIVRPPSLPRS